VGGGGKFFRGARSKEMLQRYARKTNARTLLNPGGEKYRLRHVTNTVRRKKKEGLISVRLCNPSGEEKGRDVAGDAKKKE